MSLCWKFRVRIKFRFFRLISYRYVKNNICVKDNCCIYLIWFVLLINYKCVVSYYFERYVWYERIFYEGFVCCKKILKNVGDDYGEDFSCGF